MSAVMAQPTMLPAGTVWVTFQGRTFPTAGQLVIDFIEQNCRLTKGRWRGQPFLLEPWQKVAIYRAFELDPETGRRRYRWVYIEVPKKQGKCATFDTLFTLADGSRKRADDLAVGDLLLAYDEQNATHIAAPVAALAIQAPETIYEVVTARGRVLRTTGQHPYLVRGCHLPPSLCASPKHRRCGCVAPGAPRWVQAADLKSGDRLAVALGWAKDGQFAEEDAWLLGVFCGDGGGDGRYTSADPEIIERIERRYPLSRLTDGKGQGYYARGVRPWLREHGLFGCTAYTKRVPVAVMSGGKHAYAGFLAGLLDTDGTVSLKHPALEWYSVSRELLADCQHMLAGLGINAALATKHGRYNGTVHHSYRLIVRGRRQMQRLAAMLPITHHEKRARLDYWAVRADGVGQRDTATFETDRVISVTPLPAQPTLAVEVAGVHTHVTAGLITHNSETIAAIDLYLLLADDEESPEIACGSNSEEQANLVFGAAKEMCRLSPTLAPLVECYRSEIVRKDNPAAKIMRVSAKAKTKDGLNLSGVTIDELHEFDESGEQLFNVLTNGTAAREQPLILLITTAGWDLDTLCGRYHQHALKVISGEVDDPTFLAIIYAAKSEDVNLEDDAALRRALQEANPAFGKIVNFAFYRDQRRKGAANFKRYFLNIWTGAENQWLPDGAWEECRAAPFDLDPALPVWLGFDASTRRDSTGIVAAQRDGALVSVKGRAWERPIEPATGKPVVGWKVPLTEVAEYIRTLCRTYDVRSIGYDPWAVVWLAENLELEGLPMVEVPQTPSRLAPATQGLYELIVDHNLRHDGDPVFARHIRNATPKQVDRGYILAKVHGRANDLIQALVNATYELMQPAAAEEPAPEPAIIVPEDE